MAIALRVDFDAKLMRAAARRSKDAAQARRLLALAAIHDGASRTEAARIGGVSVLMLTNLLPGAREVGGAVSAHGNAQTYVSFSGGSGQNYNMLVDGIDNKEDHCGGASIVYPTSRQPAALFRTFQEYGATMMVVVPGRLPLGHSGTSPFT